MKSLQCMVGAITLAACSSWAQAHFIWAVTTPDEQPQQVHVYFGEMAAPDDPELVKNIVGSKAWTPAGRRGQLTEISLTPGTDGLAGDLPEDYAGQPVIVTHEYGVLSKGEQPFRLTYYAKTYPSALPGTWKPVGNKEQMPLEITPDLAEEQVTFTVRWRGEPLSGSQLVIDGPGLSESLKADTNEKGQFTCKLPGAGLYSVRARQMEDVAGELDGKPYHSHRSYATLSFRHAPVQVQSAAHAWPELPHGVTSFGAAIAGDDLYVFAGNYASGHEYHRAGQSGDLWALNLKQSGAAWRKLAGGPKRTGLALQPHGGQLYRVGGFSADNDEGETEVLNSHSDFARYVPEKDAWEELPPLPEARSSHDAALVGDTLYVVGGWAMTSAAGQANDHHWHATAWSCDLSQPDLVWKPIANPPFLRRAVALAGFQGRLYVLGGMQESDGTTTRVAVYDPASDQWTEGPALLGGPMDGFGAAAFACGDRLFASTMTGSVQRLSEDGQHWELIGQLQHPRFFHRLLPWRDQLVIVGGTSMETGKVQELELLQVKRDQRSAEIR